MKKVMLIIAVAISCLLNAQGLQAVKKYNLPVHLKETDRYSVDLSPSGKFYYIYPKASIKNIDFSLKERYILNYQDYQDIITFFYELVKAEPNPVNYNYEIEGDSWYISIHKASNNFYTGSMGLKYKGKKETRKYILPDDVLFLASLPLDLEE